MSWDSYNIEPEIIESVINKLKWDKPSSIQADSFKWTISEQKDIIGIAETGSGKTGAYVIPILNDLIRTHKESKGMLSLPYALILAPTRELCDQIAYQVKILGESIKVRAELIMGGMNKVEQVKRLAQRPHIIIGTPGRIVDHLANTKGFRLLNVKHVVYDEADKLLSTEFEAEMNKIIDEVTHEDAGPKRSYLFSATMTSKVEKLKRVCLKDPVTVKVEKAEDAWEQKYKQADSLSQRYIFIPATEKDQSLVYLLRNHFSSKSLIIFTATCVCTARVSYLLRYLGVKVAPLHGQMDQNKRFAAINNFRALASNRQQICLVATDLASRGLDIPNVDVIINYDIPASTKDYVHRVGRTARAGASGLSVTFVSQYDLAAFKKTEKDLNLTMEALEQFNRAQTKNVEIEVNEAQRLATLDVKESLAQKKGGPKPDESEALKSARSLDYQNKREAYKDKREKKILKGKLGKIKQNNLKRKRK